MAYDPDLGLVVDLVACEDAHASERAGVAPLLEGARAGELWIADRHYCTRTVLRGLEDAGAGFIVREYANHPRLAEQGEWRACGRVETGLVREQAITVERLHISGVSQRTSALVMRASEADLILLCACKGMAISRDQEKLRGKRPKLSDLQHTELRGMHDIGGYSIRDLAELSVSCPIVYRTLGRQRPAT